jgi:hypothetical protein
MPASVRLYFASALTGTSRSDSLTSLAAQVAAKEKTHQQTSAKRIRRNT